MNYQEIPLVFECENCRLIGIVALPNEPSTTGVLIVVGGPQYRAGSHRQFTLLARDLAKNGTPSLRFDYRGMGDSEGAMRNFEAVDADIRSAIDAFLTAASNIQQIVIWGLCDAASAALYYAHTDARVTGLVLLNPWVHSEAGASRARLKHYYIARLLQGSFWSKLFSGQIMFGESATELLQAARHFFARQAPPPHTQTSTDKLSYIDRMLIGMQLFTGSILLILSGNDLVAQEFDGLTHSDPHWKAAFGRADVEKRVLEDANHTFSTQIHRNQACALTQQWLEKLLSRTSITL